MSGSTVDNVAAASIIAEAGVSTPKSPYGSDTLPVGYLDSQGVLHTEVTVHEMGGREEAIFASNKMESYQKFNEVLTRCTDRIGTYSDKETIAKIVPELTIADRSVLLILIRRVTYGDVHMHQATCPREYCSHHKKPTFFSVDLSSLDKYPAPEPMTRIYDGVLPRSGKSYTFHMMQGKDEPRIAKFIKVDVPSAMLLARLSTLNDRPVSFDDIQNMSSFDRDHLRSRFVEIEGGIDTTLQIVCPGCDLEYEEELDISQSGFFSPQAMRSRWKKKFSS